MELELPTVTPPPPPNSKTHATCPAREQPRRQQTYSRPRRLRRAPSGGGRVIYLAGRLKRNALPRPEPLCPPDPALSAAVAAAAATTSAAAITVKPIVQPLSLIRFDSGGCWDCGDGCCGGGGGGGSGVAMVDCGALVRSGPQNGCCQTYGKNDFWPSHFWRMH